MFSDRPRRVLLAIGVARAFAGLAESEAPTQPTRVNLREREPTREICAEYTSRSAPLEPNSSCVPAGIFRPWNCRTERAGLAIDVYEETPGWQARIASTYRAILAALPIVSQEAGSLRRRRSPSRSRRRSIDR
jgi:hypothetical protein